MGKGSSGLSKKSGGGGAVNDEMSTKGYVGLSGDASDAFMDDYHNKNLIHNGMNTMDGAQARRINDALRKGVLPSDAKDQKLMNRLDKEIAKNELPYDMTFFRGVPLEAFNNTGAFSGFQRKTVSMNDYKKADGSIDFEKWGKAYASAEAQNNASLLQMSKSLIGKRIVDDGFLFASASSERSAFIFSDVNLQIRAKKGTHAYISNYKTESETIFGRGHGLNVVGSSIATVKAANGNQKQILQLIVDMD